MKQIERAPERSPLWEWMNDDEKRNTLIRWVRAEGMSYAELGRRMGVGRGVVSTWRKKYREFGQLFEPVRERRDKPKKRKRRLPKQCIRCCWKRPVGQGEYFCLWPVCPKGVIDHKADERAISRAGVGSAEGAQGEGSESADGLEGLPERQGEKDQGRGVSASQRYGQEAWLGAQNGPIEAI
jgi:hypothetical protein